MKTYFFPPVFPRQHLPPVNSENIQYQTKARTKILIKRHLFYINSFEYAQRERRPFPWDASKCLRATSGIADKSLAAVPPTRYILKLLGFRTLRAVPLGCLTLPIHIWALLNQQSSSTSVAFVPRLDQGARRDWDTRIDSDPLALCIQLALWCWVYQS